MKRLYPVESFAALPQLGRWLFISTLVGILAGLGSGLFLASLDWATDWRESHPWMIALLPIGGLFSGWLYHRYGQSIEAGNNLLLEEIHNPRQIIPLRMAPMVLLGTDLTHLFGGSAGREGTALQIATSLADQLTPISRLNPRDRRILLMAGLSSGFSSVFGTPLAGTVFGLEVLAIGTFSHQALFPCLVAAIVGDLVTLSLGLTHTAYRHPPEVPPLTATTVLAAALAGILFGLVAMVFAKLTHAISHRFKATIAYPPLRPAIGGAMVALIIGEIGSTKYIGLGIPTIVDAFSIPLPPWDFAAKIGLTALTLGAGFKGGEVTPLFFIGATLGNALSSILALPIPLLAGMGFVAVFGGAANTPIASTLMGIELFGGEAGVFIAIACVMSYLFSGHTGIYGAQRIGASKYHFKPIKAGTSLTAHAQNLPSNLDAPPEDPRH